MKILVEITTGLPVHDAKIFSPVLNRIFAPFLDFPSYFLTLPQPKEALLSWIVWLLLIWSFIAYFKFRVPLREKITLTIRGGIVIVFSFSLFILFSIFFPIPQSRIQTDRKGEVFIDLHSHTIYSHDGIATPLKSLLRYTNSGFQAWAVTEHDHIGPAAEIIRKELKEKRADAIVINGQEINFQRAHLNILGITQDIEKREHDNLSSLIESVHKQGGAVIVPHYWAEIKSPFNMKELADAGVDGFEIAGFASVPLTKHKQQEIIAFCRKEGLPAISGSNWHGWGAPSFLWTGFQTEGWAEMDKFAREDSIIEALRKREAERFRVLGYPQRYPCNYLFEPFIGPIHYFSTLKPCAVLSYLFWAPILFLIIRFIKRRRQIAFFIWSFIGLTLMLKGLFIFTVWKNVSEVNKILPDISKGLLFFAMLSFFLALTNVKRLRRPPVNEQDIS